MAKTIYSHFTNLLLLFALFFYSTIIEALKGSLRFELIHRNSPRSPTYNPNLTNSQLFEESFYHSEHRFLQLNNSQPMLVGHNITSIRPPVTYYKSLYMVFLTIGTGNGTIGYYFTFDTGSELTWTQCKPCLDCYPQNDPYFDPHHSPSFVYISCSNQNPCPQSYFHCIHGQCLYGINYNDGSYTRGILSKDTFGFRSSHGEHVELLEGLTFGCSRDTKLVMAKQGYPSGIMALGLRDGSFTKQLINHGSHGRFSYCLLPIGSTSTSFLRFGDNIVQRGPVQTTSIIQVEGVPFYYIILNDISVGTKRVGFEPSMFARKPDGSGGFFVDSGTFITRLINPAFEKVKKVLRTYFQDRGVVEVDPEKYGQWSKVCWLFQPTYMSLMPSMTLHLQGAEMIIQWLQLFNIVLEKGIFCWAIMPQNNTSILGVYQQINTRFTFDVLQLRLTFNPENCDHDSQP